MQETSARINVVFPIIQQCVVMMLGVGILFEGEYFDTVGYAALAYWCGFGIVMARRRGGMTGADKVLIRWGFLILCFASALITGFIWHLRGF